MSVDTEYLSLANIPFALLKFCLIVFIYSLNDKCSLRLTPKYFAQRLGLIMCPGNQKCSFCFVLLALKDILFALSYCIRLEGSNVIVLFNSFKERLAHKSLVSSVNDAS